jgi:glucans biosynthesis protein
MTSMFFFGPNDRTDVDDFRPSVHDSDGLAIFNGRGEDSKIFVLDLVGDKLKSVDPKNIRGAVSAEKAKIQNIVTQPNPATGGWRLSFEISKEKAPVELRASLMQGNDAISEVWVYRWTP